MKKPRRAYRSVFALTLSLIMILSSFNVSAATQPGSSDQGNGTYKNPVIWADVPDMDIVKVNGAYYMSSTSMHMSPGVPIMKSYDLVNWETVSYCYNVLGDADILKLQTGQNSYSQGSWASSLRYKDGTFYLVVPARVEGSTWRAQVFTTTDPETVPWTRHELPSRYHDCGLVLDDDGRNYLVYGGGEIVELNADLTAAIPGTQRKLINSLYAPHPISGDMPASGTLSEGSHMRKIGDYYYLISITGGGYPSGQTGSGWLRTVSAHRAKSLTTPADQWESRVLGMESVNGSGVAQGDIIYIGDGDPNVDRNNWYGLFFRDSDAGGRMPWLMPVTWVNDWPMLGEGGSYTPYPRTGNIPITISGGSEKKSVVTSDEFYNNAPRPLYYDTPVTTASAFSQAALAEAVSPQSVMGTFSLDNLALNKPARASRVENDSVDRAPAAAFDGIIEAENTGGNRWGNPGGTSDNWIEVDLGEECDLDSVKIYWFNSNTPARIHYYNVWVKSGVNSGFVKDSVTGSGKTTSQFLEEGYTRAVDKTGNTVGIETTDSLTGVKARYVAVHVTGQSAGTAASIREIQIFGSVGAPGIPGNVAAARGDGEVTLTWTTPTPGGSPITKMQVSVDDGAWIDLPADATTYTFTGLVNGVWHAFNVRAVNSIDNGKAASARQTAWPAGGASRNIVINGDFEDSDISMWTVNDTAVNTRIEDPLNPGNYVMKSSGRTTTGSGPAQLQTKLLAPMVKGKTYTVSAKVYYGEHVSPATGTAHANRQFYINIKGGGSYSSEYNPIRNMAGVNASRNGWRTMTGSYTVPDDLQEPYSNIFVETSYASSPTETANLFDFLVDDISIIGPPVGDPPTDPMVPGVPSSVQATPGNARATLNWAPPANIGGSAITGYKVSIDGINWTALGDNIRSYTFTGLNNGTKYTFSVRAVNNEGDGAIATIDATPTVETGSLYGYNGSNLNLAWQWNHNPDNRYWSLTERSGWLRLRTGYISPHILQAPNTLTQRTFGPNSSAYTYIDVSNMKNGDEAGITLFTAKYGSIGVKMEDGAKTIVTTLANTWSSGHATNAGVVNGTPVPLTGNGIYLKAEANLVPNPASNPYGSNARGRFYYSFDGITWTLLGSALNMSYSTSNHFMGYRFGLYNFAKTETGGYVDFDFYRISDTLTAADAPTVLGASMTSQTGVAGSAGASADVQLLLDPLPAGTYSEIAASFEIPKYVTVSGVSFASGVTGKTSWNVKGNQLELSVTGVAGNPLGFSPDSRSTFATIRFTLDRDLVGDLNISIVPDYVIVKSSNVVYNIADVKASIGFTGTISEESSKFTSANPYLPLWEHLPDNEPRVFEDPDNPGKYRAYIIGSHDTRRGSYCGPDIRMWSAPVEDLSNWRDDGAIFTYRQTSTSNWDVMYAPDLVEVRRFAPEVIARGRTPQDERTIVEYYLYPHSTSDNGMVCKSDRPDGPYVPVNLGTNGRSLSGSIVGFDPSAWVDYIDDPTDPDYNIGFRAYVYYGFQRSYADELNQDTMWSRRPGTSRIDYFMPSSSSYGVLRDPAGTVYPCLAPGEDPKDFNFFEASSMRKVGNKYIVVFSGYSGPDYGMGSTNSALRWAYGDTPLGPFKSGGVLVDSRGPVPNQNGTGLVGGQWGHNTHGSLWEINGQWYTTYHRPPRGNGNARQAVVAPIKIKWTEPSVLNGGTVSITGYDPFAEGEVWTAKAGSVEYKGAEVTSEGFNVYGLPPYRYYSAGIVSDHQGTGTLQDNYDIWDSHMPVENAQNGYRAGFKYFGFGGLVAGDPDKGLKAFEGTSPGNNTKFNVWLTPKTTSAFTVNVWLDGPWANSTWKGTQIGTISVPADSAQVPTQFTVDVSSFVDNLDGKHAIYLVMSGGSGALCDLLGLGFSSDKHEIERPVSPVPSISVGGTAQTIPAQPIASTNANGIYDYFRYQVSTSRPSGDATIVASASDPSVKVMVTQAPASGAGLVRYYYNGVMKEYRLFSSFVNIATADADAANVAAILEADDIIGSRLAVNGSGLETPEQLIALAQPILNGMISSQGVACEIAYDANADWYVIKLSKGDTTMTVQQFEIVMASESYAIYVNGAAVPNFDPETLMYFVAVPVAPSLLISATLPSASGLKYSVEYPEKLPGVAKVIVTDELGTDTTYILNLRSAVSASQDKKTFSVDIADVTGVPKNVKVVLAAYKENGQLAEVASSELTTIPANGYVANVTVSLTGDTTGKIVKAFIWDDNYLPYVPAFDLDSFIQN